MFYLVSKCLDSHVLNGFQAANDPIAPNRGIPREDIEVCESQAKHCSPKANLS